MPSVDDRVVKMEFQNQQFERNAAQSMGTLSKLEQSLQLKNAGAGLKDIDAASKALSFEHIGQGLSGLSAKFVALSTVAITALSNITNRAVDAGVRIAKSLSLDTVMAGFREYELNIGSIQTILSNTRSEGTNLQQVNAALDELNSFADKTIYNFAQMTKNVGTFTAAGVKLGVALPSIKGIANLAALSGSSAEQASTAMYQLSQAIASGTVKLIDWNSVVNAGMGGEVFQKSLFEAGKAMKTLKGVDMGTTFEQWKNSGHSFRDSLQDGWITADVLTTVLGGLSGEMDAATLKSKGFSDQQIKDMLELGQAGVDAATKVRTFTGLMGTLKESIGSGWAASFRTIIGDFNEATNLFTGLSKTIGGFFSHQADVRNMTLMGAKQGGAMLLVVDGLRKGFSALAAILRPIGQAFRETFPRKTAQDLVNMSKSFNDFMTRLRPSVSTVANIKYAFKGLFSALSIGWTVIKEGVKFIADLIKTVAGLGGVGSGKFLTFFANLGQSVTDLKKKLVDGGGIAKFFDTLRAGVDKVIPYIRDFAHWIGDLFGGFKSEAADKVSGTVDRVGSRFDQLKSTLGRAANIFDPLFRALDRIAPKLDKVLDVIKNWFSQLGQKIADTMGKGDWDAVLDAVNIGLLGGIAALLGKWMKNGITVDPTGGMFKSVKDSFDQLTNTLSTMQTKIKADIIEKIAISVGILTAAVVALSLIDPAALTRALGAMAVGFGQLLGAFKILDTMDVDAKSAGKFAVISTALNLLATSMVILAGAVALLGNLKPETLIRGIAGVTILLGEMVLITPALSDAAPGMILAGTGIVALSVGITILAGAVKLFSMMSWGEIAKGLASVWAALVIIAATMTEMPATMPLTAAGVIEIAIAMNILGGAMKIFATMSWGELAKGAAALAGALIIIAATMTEMPITLPITAAGMVILANALVIMGAALKLFATMDWGEIGKSLTVLAASMLILTLAMNGMSGAAGGAVALFIMVAALAAFQKVLETFAGMKWGDLFKGLGMIAIALVALGVTSTVMSIFIPMILALGIALLVVASAFAVFGAGALLTAKAFAIFAESGEKGAKAFIKVMEAMGEALPAIFVGLGRGIVNFILEIGKGIPPLVKIIAALLDQLLDTVIKLIPKFVTVGMQLIGAFVLMAYSQGPVFIALGFFLLNALLQGIQDNIGRISQQVMTIIGTFLLVLAANAQNLTDAGFAVLLAFLKGVEDNMGKVIDKGADIIVKIIEGIGNNAGKITTAAVDTIIKFAGELEKNMGKLIDKGAQLIVKFIEGIGNDAGKIADAAAKAVIKFIDGISSAIDSNSEAFRRAGTRLAGSIIDGMTGGLASRGHEVVEKAGSIVGDAVKTMWDKVMPGSPSKVTTDMGQRMGDGLVQGLGQRQNDVVRAAENIVDDAMSTFNGHIRLMAQALETMDDFTPTITPVLDLSQVQADASKIADYIQSAKVTPTVSLKQAQAIAAATVSRSEPTPAPTESSAPTFQQIINSPTQLSTGDIYKNTRNQIALAKEELSIP